jgi:tetratricopeptide (TPR) repeat protein
MNKLIPITTLLLSTQLSAAPLYKMAVVSDGTSSSAIKKGAYEQGITAINASDQYKDMYQRLTDSMNLCVAHVSLAQIEKAETACETAVLLTKHSKDESSQLQKIASLALNNRAILKIKSNNYQGALADLLDAMEVNNSSLIKTNLIKLIQKQSEKVQFKS